MEQTLLTAELYASKLKGSEGDDWYTHFYYHLDLMRMCFPGDVIVKVRLTELEEPEDGCYWSWKKLLDNKLKAEPLPVPEFHFTCSHVMGVEMCFPYGSKSEEARGEGKLVPVKLEIIDVVT